MTGEQLISRPAAALVLVAATLLAFYPVVTFDFVSWDDYETVARNPRLAPPTPASLATFWTRPHMNLYTPVTYTVWAVLANAAPQRPTPPVNSTLNPRLFHALNLALHAAAALVVFAVLLDVFETTPAALGGAMLFALHPVQVEPVAWVSGAKDLLCGLLSIVALWQYLQYVRMRRADAEPSAPAERWRACGFATLALVLALLSKP